jgi:AcrR family transcriptional regulator
MAKSRTGDTRARILEAAAEILRARGQDALTFDAVAARLGVTKQAVIYWFPSKADLFKELALPGLRAEVEAVERALAGAPAPAAAARDTVRALIGFHLGDLARFRLMYLVPQIGVSTASRAAAEVVAQVHPVTARMYAAIAAAIGDGSPAGDESARETAVALHMAALGHVLLHALADALDDPLRHRAESLADRLATLLAAGIDERPPAGEALPA